MDQSTKQVEVLRSEKLSTENIIREKDLIIGNLNRHLEKKAQEIRDRETEMQTVMKRRADADREQTLQERK